MAVSSSRGVEEARDARSKPHKREERLQAESNAESPAQPWSKPEGIGPVWGAPVVVLTTVAQVRAALRRAREVGWEAVVLWARCAGCGRVGRVLHFEGVVRARARDPDP